MERSKVIFGNPISEKDYRKAVKNKQKHYAKFGNDQDVIYPLGIEENPVLGPEIGVKNIVITTSSNMKVIDFNSNGQKPGMIIGNIRMGFGHYRISMAIASVANAMGFTPYWFDLHAYEQTTGGKVIKHLNNLYAMGSRWSQKYPLFNKLYWEPLNSEGFKKLTYNAMDQKVSELMTPIFTQLPKTLPFVGTHVWPSQAAVHAGMKRVVNVIPDNWPMALHLAEGALHTVQTPSAYLGYRTLKGMDGEKILKPMPAEVLYDTGHYIDHELVVNLEADTKKRFERIDNEQAKRVLITVGGAGAQKEILIELIKKMMPDVATKKVTLLINVGDHKNVWEGLCQAIPELNAKSTQYFDQWEKTKAFSKQLLTETVHGIHAFYHTDIFAAVYASNLLMRASDILITKPSELAFYPIPKLMIKRVGGHEAWGAIRAAEVGDGTTECGAPESAVQMLLLMLHEKAILSQMNQHILNAHQIGIYNGAYEVVKLVASLKV